jgi:putative ABC transport system permease protein
MTAMRIPLTYNLRNLLVRRTTTIMTALGMALTVTVLLAALALVDGLRAAFRSSGDPLNVLVLRKGSSSELSSGMSEETYRDMLFKPGVAQGRDQRRPLLSLEMVTVITLPKPGSVNGQATTLRGLLPVGIEIRPVKLKEGRWFQPGHLELVVGESVARRCPAARVGEWLRIGNSAWEVVGVMDAGSSAVNSEVFADLNQVSNYFNRRDQFNSALVHAADESSLPQLVESLNDDQRLNVTAQTEKSYYEAQAASGAPLEHLGVLVALIMSIGSCFAAMNTMYAAVGRRSREIGTLRVLGFSRGSILLSFLIESLLLASLGGVTGCLLVLPLNYVTTAIGNFSTMSETAFRFHVGPLVIGIGIVFAWFLGGIGGFLPARNAARKEILVALREN